MHSLKNLRWLSRQRKRQAKMREVGFRIILKNPNSDDIELKPLDDRIVGNVVRSCLGRYETIIVQR